MAQSLLLSQIELTQFLLTFVGVVAGFFILSSKAIVSVFSRFGAVVIKVRTVSNFVGRNACSHVSTVTLHLSFPS